VEYYSGKYYNHRRVREVRLYYSTAGTSEKEEKNIKKYANFNAEE